MDRQALKAAFARKDIHGRLARWLDFLAEYDFKLRYRSDASNKAAGFLFRIDHGEPGPDNLDEGEICIALYERQSHQENEHALNLENHAYEEVDVEEGMLNTMTIEDP